MFDVALTFVQELYLFRIDVDPQHAHARARKLERKRQSHITETDNSDFHCFEVTMIPDSIRFNASTSLCPADDTVALQRFNDLYAFGPRIRASIIGITKWTIG